MSLAAIAYTSTPMEDYAGYWVKFYEQGTTTPKSMATDAAGGTLLAQAEISSGGVVPIGFIKTTGSAIFIPYVDGAYDQWLFPTEQEAIDNNTTNAIQLADNIIAPSLAGAGATAIQEDTVLLMTINNNKAYEVDDVVVTKEFAVGAGGGGVYDVVLTSSVIPNTFNVIIGVTDALISFVLREKAALTFEEVGSVGTVDEAALIANVFSRAQGKTIKGLNGKTYVSSLVQPMLTSTELDLGGSTLKFTGTTSEKDLEPATGCEVHNGAIEEAGSGHTGSGETHCPVSIGNFQSGVGVENVSIHDLTLISNKPDGVLCGIWGGSNNIEVYNIITPTSSTVNSVVEAHWGGQAVDDAVQHPHDIRIDNIRCDGMTSTTVGGAMVFLSSVYNVDVSNIKGDDVIRGVVVSAGDWGDDYSVAAQKGKIGKNITLDNVLITDCFKTGLQIDGFTAFGLTDHDNVIGDTSVSSPDMTNVSSTSKLFVGRVIAVAGAGEFQIRGISGTTVVLDRDAGVLLTGAVVTGGSWDMKVKVTNSSFECDGSGTVVAPMTIQATSSARFENVELSGGLTHGLSFLNWVNHCNWSGGHIHDNQNNGVDENRGGKSNNNTFDGVKFTKNNLAAGTGRTDACSILFSSSNNKAINCDFGQEAQETTYIHVSTESTARNSEFTGNNFLGSVSGGFALRNGAAGNVEDHATKTLFANNSIASTVTPLYKVSGGTPPLTNRWLNPIENTENVRWANNFAPTAAAHIKGDEVDQSSPAVGSPQGWTCTVSGTPGTWVARPNL